MRSATGPDLFGRRWRCEQSTLFLARGGWHLTGGEDTGIDVIGQPCRRMSPGRDIADL